MRCENDSRWRHEQPASWTARLTDQEERCGTGMGFVLVPFPLAVWNSGPRAIILFSRGALDPAISGRPERSPRPPPAAERPTAKWSDSAMRSFRAHRISSLEPDPRL